MENKTKTTKTYVLDYILENAFYTRLKGQSGYVSMQCCGQILLNSLEKYNIYLCHCNGYCAKKFLPGFLFFLVC